MAAGSYGMEREAGEMAWPGVTMHAYSVTLTTSDIEDQQ